MSAAVRRLLSLRRSKPGLQSNRANGHSGIALLLTARPRNPPSQFRHAFPFRTRTSMVANGIPLTTLNRFTVNSDSRQGIVKHLRAKWSSSLAQVLDAHLRTVPCGKPVRMSWAEIFVPDYSGGQFANAHSSGGRPGIEEAQCALK